MNQNMDLQFISHFTERYTYLDSIRMALEGGCRWVQLRMKDASEDELLCTGLEVRRLCDRYQATFIVDDYVELVPQVRADGVHLGKKDMSIKDARRLLGSDYIIGGTANSFEDVLQHYEASADYIGCGPFRFTTTKQGLSPILGLEGYRSIVDQMKAHGIDLPIVAIGGITADDIPLVMQTGVSGVALSGSVLRAEEPVKEMKKIIDLMHRL